MPNIGFPEMMVILIIALIVFGPGKLPEIGGSIGKAMREFRRASSELTEELTREVEVKKEMERRHEAPAPEAEAITSYAPEQSHAYDSQPVQEPVEELLGPPHDNNKSPAAAATAQTWDI